MRKSCGSRIQQANIRKGIATWDEAGSISSGDVEREQVGGVYKRGEVWNRKQREQKYAVILLLLGGELVATTKRDYLQSQMVSLHNMLFTASF